MEILRFDESVTPAPKSKRKHSSRGYIAIGLVATMFGIGTAFASSTITVNEGTGGLISLGAGVTAVTNCDDSITVTPHSGVVLERGKAPAFKVDSIVISNINGADPDPVTKLGCEGMFFTIQVYDSSTGTVTPKPCNTAPGNLGFTPDASTAVTDADSTLSICGGANDSIKFQIHGGTVAPALGSTHGKSGNEIYVINTDFSSNFDYITLVSSNS